MSSILQDLRYGVRTLSRSPGFTAIAVLTLTLGIGANAAIWSVVNAVLLRPLPYPESGRLVWLSERGTHFPTMSISYPDYIDWRAQQTVFEHLGVYQSRNYNLTGEGEPLQLDGVPISPGAFAALRAQPAIGRLFGDDEDKPGAPPVVVLSHGLWQGRFGRDAGVLNRSIALDGRSYAVLGVMPADFAFPRRVDVWTPVGQLAGEPGFLSRGNHPGLLGVARLASGVSLEQARVEMDAIATRLEQQYSDTNKNVRVRIESLLDDSVGSARRGLWILLGAVGLVLLIACANVANLLLARAAVRRKEMALRIALGASRWRIVRQLVTESVLLAAMGGALGLLLARAGVPLIRAIGGDSLPRSSEVGLDAGVLGFAAVVALLTGVLFGMAPAWQSSGPDLHGMLKETARSTTSKRVALRQALVVAEVALTLVLLIGAGLLLRSFCYLHRVDAGFAHHRVLSFRLDLPQRKYATEAQQTAFYQSLCESLSALPGVEAVGFASQLPFDDYGWQTGFLIEGRPAPPPGEGPSMEVTVASPDYFRVMGIPLLRGRYFTAEDNREHLRGRDLAGLGLIQRWSAGLDTVIVDQEFARQHWPNEDPIGKRVRLPWGREPVEQPLLVIVGVVARLKLNRLSEEGGFVQAYLPMLQATSGDAAVVIKTTREPKTFAAAARRLVLAADPEQPIHDVRTLTELRDDSLAPERLSLTLLGSFAAVALLLATIGLFGVIAYAVAQRTQEIGIRMALGAQRRDVLKLVIGQGLKLTLVGIALGLVGALALTRLLQNLLFGVSATDPLTFGAIALLLTVVAVLACSIPARRATRVDPTRACNV